MILGGTGQGGSRTKPTPTLRLGGLRFLRLPAPLALSVLRLLHLEPRERPALYVGGGLMFPDQPLIAALDHLGPRLEAAASEPGGQAAGQLRRSQAA